MGDDDSPHSCVPSIDRYLHSLWLERGLRKNTLAAYRRDLDALAVSLQARGKVLDSAHSQDILDCLTARYAAGLSARSNARWLSAVKGYYKHQVRVGRAAADPSLSIDHPKTGRPLPKVISGAQVEALLAAPDTHTPVGLRDRAMLELLYACGLRISELVALDVIHVNFRQGVVRVLGKGGKERLVPAGAVALDWVQRFLDDGRAALLPGGGAVLFPSQRARHMTRQTFWHGGKEIRA